jgi:protein-disulfide isomerase
MKRYLPFAIILLVAVLTVGAGAMLYRAKERTSLKNAPTAASRGDLEDKSLHVRGQADASVTLEEFGDFQCPSCAVVSGVLRKLEQDYGRRLRVVFRQHPLAMHEYAMEAALAAEAAGFQGHFWEMHDMLYQYQSVWSKASNVRRFFHAYAQSLGLDVERFDQDSNSDEVRARIISDGESGVSRGVKNTPTIFVNGREVRTAFTEAHLRKAIDTAINETKSR